MTEILTLINEIIKQIRSLFEFFKPDKEVTLDEIETKVRQVMLEMGRQIVEGIIRFRGTGYMGKVIRTPEGELAEYHEKRSRTIETLMGPVKIERAYYRVSGGGYVPLDESLSLPEERYSYTAQEAMSLFAIEDSYEESAKKLSL